MLVVQHSKMRAARIDRPDQQGGAGEHALLAAAFNLHRHWQSAFCQGSAYCAPVWICPKQT